MNKSINTEPGRYRDTPCYPATVTSELLGGVVWFMFENSKNRIGLKAMLLCPFLIKYVV